MILKYLTICSRFLIVFSLVIAGYPLHAQKMTLDSQRVGFTANIHMGSYCKYLAVMNFTPGCSQTIYYMPAYNCEGKKMKAPYFRFKTEVPYIKRMVDSVALHEPLELCMFDIMPGDYDDVKLNLIDIFSTDKEWLDHMKAKPGEFDAELYRKLLGRLHVIKEIDEFLSPYKFAIGTHTPVGDKQFISKKELKRLGKDEHLLIPLPEHLKIQLHGKL